MFCSHCGNNVGDRSKYCENCGSVVRRPQQFECHSAARRPQQFECHKSYPPSHHYSYQPSPAPGKNFLMVASLVLIIYGASGIISSLSGLVLYDYWDWNMPLPRVSWLAYYLFALAANLFGIVVGIVGFINRERVSKASLCMMLAVLSIIVAISVGVFMLYATFGSWFVFILLFSIPADILISLIYYIGAKRNAAVANDTTREVRYEQY